MLIRLAIITTIDATTADLAAIGPTLEQKQALKGNRIFGNATIYVDADMSATGTPNFDVQINYVGANGKVAVADTLPGTSLTTDGIYILEPLTGFMVGGNANGSCFLPDIDNLAVDVTEISGTGSIVLATVYAIVKD